MIEAEKCGYCGPFDARKCQFNHRLIEAQQDEKPHQARADVLKRPRYWSCPARDHILAFRDNHGPQILCEEDLLPTVEIGVSEAAVAEILTLEEAVTTIQSNGEESIFEDETDSHTELGSITEAVEPLKSQFGLPVVKVKNSKDSQRSKKDKVISKTDGENQSRAHRNGKKDSGLTVHSEPEELIVVHEPDVEDPAVIEYEGQREITRHVPRLIIEGIVERTFKEGAFEEFLTKMKLSKGAFFKLLEALMSERYTFHKRTRRLKKEEIESLNNKYDQIYSQLQQILKLSPQLLEKLKAECILLITLIAREWLILLPPSPSEDTE